MSKESIFIIKDGVEILNAKPGLCMMTGYLFASNEWKKQEYVESRKRRGVDLNERRRKGYKNAVVDELR